MRTAFLISVFLYSAFFVLNSQQLTPDLKSKVDEYKQYVEKYKKEGNNSSVVNYLNKIGSIYMNANMPNDAISNYTEALSFLEKSSNTTAKVQINNQLGYLYSSLEDYSNAEKYFTNSYNLLKTSSDKTNLASALSNLAQSLQHQKKYDQAIVKYEEALSFALELDNLLMVKNISLKLAMCYKEKGDEQNYAKYYNLSANFDKKIAEIELQKKQQELLFQSQIAQQNKLKLEIEQYKNQQISDSLLFQQKMNEENQYKIDLLNKDKELKDLALKSKEQELENQKTRTKARNSIIIVLVLGLGLLGVAFLFIFRLFVQNKKQKDKLELLNSALEGRNKEIEQNRKELLQKNKQITDSINYASRIQQAILPLKKAIEASFKNVIIFYRPRDVVSGDFYWYTQFDNTRILAAIDCTGHSVPGAFMSLIANTLLNEIIKAKKIIKLDEILTHLNKGVIDTLHSYSETDDLNDGMDITLYKFEENSRKAKFASSNHVSIAFVDDKTLVLEGSLFSLGSQYSENTNVNFKEIEFDLGTKATLYLFSDGFVDQFNEQGKKYSSKKFFNFLNTIHELPFSEQEAKLESELETWRGKYRQVDDILVIGVEV